MTALLGLGMQASLWAERVLGNRWQLLSLVQFVKDWFSHPLLMSSLHLQLVCAQFADMLHKGFVYSKHRTSMLCHQTLCPQHSHWTPSMRSSRHWQRNCISYHSTVLPLSLLSRNTLPPDFTNNFHSFFFNFGGPYISSCFLFNQIHTFPSCFISLPL